MSNMVDNISKKSHIRHVHEALTVDMFRIDKLDGEAKERGAFGFKVESSRGRIERLGLILL